MRQLHRYWFEFEFTDVEYRQFPYFPGKVGVSAYDSEDAVKLVRRWISRHENGEIPPIKRLIEDVDISEYFPIGERLPQQLGCSIWRGVWYPALNLFYGPDQEP